MDAGANHSIVSATNRRAHTKYHYIRVCSFVLIFCALHRHCTSIRTRPSGYGHQEQQQAAFLPPSTSLDYNYFRPAQHLRVLLRKIAFYATTTTTIDSLAVIPSEGANGAFFPSIQATKISRFSRVAISKRRARITRRIRELGRYC